MNTQGISWYSIHKIAVVIECQIYSVAAISGNIWSTLIWRFVMYVCCRWIVTLNVAFDPYSPIVLTYYERVGMIPCSIQQLITVNNSWFCCLKTKECLRIIIFRFKTKLFYHTFIHSIKVRISVNSFGSNFCFITLFLPPLLIGTKFFQGGIDFFFEKVSYAENRIEGQKSINGQNYPVTGAFKLVKYCFRGFHHVFLYSKA